ncbi:MAG: hypothetical protein IJ379_13215 [Lachnospiraceae bacterium]|nr:hypothetical protein [Lachnospiraceae bacterium]
MAKKKQKGVFNHYKGRIRREIQEYCREKEIPQEEFHFLSLYQWENVHNRIVESFANHQWLAQHKGIHWLNTCGGFKEEPYFTFDCDDKWDWILKVPELLADKDELVYVLIEDDHNYWVAEGNLARVVEIIYEMAEDDYYIVDKKYHWMITENHHGGVAFVGERLAVEKLQIDPKYVFRFVD